MKKDTSILPLFSNLDCQYTIRQLVEKTYKIALVYLRCNSKRLSKIFLNAELTFEETAISAIASLFCRDSEGQILPIVKEFNSWQPPIQTEDDAVYFLNKVTASRVEQHISHLLKENDPFFGKILESVKYLTRKHGYKKVCWFGKGYIVQSIHDEINHKPIDQDSFEKLPGTLFQNPKTLLADIFTYLNEETKFFPAIPLNALVIRLRELNRIDFHMQTNVSSVLTKSDIDEIVSVGLNQSLKKLNDSYYVIGKIDKNAYENFRKALYDMARDLKDGGIHHGLYDYLKQYSNTLERQEYQSKYHNILEYLLKVMKNTIRQKLTENKP